VLAAVRPSEAGDQAGVAAPIGLAGSAAPATLPGHDPTSVALGSLAGRVGSDGQTDVPEPPGLADFDTETGPGVRSAAGHTEPAAPSVSSGQTEPEALAALEVLLGRPSALPDACVWLFGMKTGAGRGGSAAGAPGGSAAGAPEVFAADEAAGPSAFPAGSASPGQTESDLFGQTESVSGQTEPDGLAAGLAAPAVVGNGSASSPEPVLGQAGLAEPDGLGGSPDPDVPASPPRAAGTVVSDADGQAEPVCSLMVSAGWSSSPGRLLCAPICTTSSSRASVETAQGHGRLDQVKNGAQIEQRCARVARPYRPGHASVRAGGAAEEPTQPVTVTRLP